MTYEMPRRFGREEKDGKDPDRPEPLQGEGNAIGPLAAHGDEAFKHAGGDELTHNEAPDVHPLVLRRLFSSIIDLEERNPGPRPSPRLDPPGRGCEG